MTGGKNMENETKRYTGAELKVGMTAERTKTITKRDIELFGDCL